MSFVHSRALPLVLTCLAAGVASGAPLAADAPPAAVAPLPATKPIRGTLDKEEIRAIIRRHLDEVRFCYEQRLIDVPTLAGRVMMQFVISGDGSVTKSAVENTTMNDPQTEACISAALLRWTFPKPKGGGIVIVSYPFVLKPADPAAPIAPLPKTPEMPRIEDGNAARAVAEQSPAMPRVIARPDPQLPSVLAGQAADASYHVCVGVDGRVIANRAFGQQPRDDALMATCRCEGDGRPALFIDLIGSRAGREATLDGGQVTLLRAGEHPLS